MFRNKEEPCFHIRYKGVGDELIVLCDLNDKICLLESDVACDIYREQLEEKDANSSG